MENDIDIKEASLIIFPIFFGTLDPEKREVLKEDGAVRLDIDKKIKKWAEITLEILNEFFPPDIFTGVSGDKGPKAVVLIREILTEGLKK